MNSLIVCQYLEDARFSSVISDERYDNTVIKLDKQGFHPHFVYVQKVCIAEKTYTCNLLFMCQ